MTEERREHYPLLHEDFSEEEHFGSKKRFNPTFRNRSRNKLNGAASIFKRWPGFWSTAFIYWWIGLGMLVITTLLIYNGMTALALFPPEHFRTPLLQTINNNLEQKSTGNPSFVRTLALPDVFMHDFLNLNEGTDFTKYLPYIDILKKRYNEYSYHLIIVRNDTMIDQAANENKNNEVALNSILHSSYNLQNSKINGVFIEHISLSEYLDASPLRKHWRDIPYQLIEFLVRAVSIWDKGGIAFNPQILTPHSPNPIYIEKIENILKLFKRNNNLERPTNDKKHFEHNLSNLMKDKPIKDNPNPRRKVNNIRDIIDAMQLDENHQQEIANVENDQLSLETAESRLPSPVIVNILNSTKIVIDKISEYLRPNKDNIKSNETENDLTAENKYDINTTNPLYYNIEKLNKTSEKNSLSNVSIWTNVLKNILIGNDMPKFSISSEFPVIESNTEKIIIDLAGNILATRASCHAFLGSLFTNTVHHYLDESVNELLIPEATAFCKGNLPCDAIDVIFNL